MSTFKISGKAVYNNPQEIQMPWGVMQPYFPISGVPIQVVALDVLGNVVFRSTPTLTSGAGSYTIKDVPSGYNLQIHGFREPTTGVGVRIQPQFHWVYPTVEDVDYYRSLVQQVTWDNMPELFKRSMNMVAGEHGKVTETDLQQIEQWILNQNWDEERKCLVGSWQEILIPLYPSQTNINNINVPFIMEGHTLGNKVNGMS